METKFNKILKIHKNLVNKIERELLNINATISQKEEKIENLNNTINKMQIPKVSIYGDFLMFKNKVNLFLSQIQNENNMLDLMKSSRIDINKRYKTALIEYEKINYLHLLEIKEKTNKLKKQEQKTIDEFSGILHHRNKMDREFE